MLAKEHQNKVKSHAAFAPAAKIFDAFIAPGTAVCPTSSCKALVKSLFKDVKAEQKAIDNIPWASLVAWSQEADNANEVCSGLEDTNAETKNILLLPSFILARLFLKQNIGTFVVHLSDVCKMCRPTTCGVRGLHPKFYPINCRGVSSFHKMFI